jgi:hypothetical protein
MNGLDLLKGAQEIIITVPGKRHPRFDELGRARFAV